VEACGFAALGVYQCHVRFSREYSLMFAFVLIDECQPRGMSQFD
jgi:hypothetical protein